MTKHPATLTREMVASALAELSYARPIAVDEITDEQVAELGRYLFTVKSQHETRRGVAWHALISRDGETVLDVRDDGDGGCLWVQPADSSRYANSLDEVLNLSSLGDCTREIFRDAIEPMSATVTLIDLLSEARRDHATLIVA